MASRPTKDRYFSTCLSSNLTFHFSFFTFLRVPRTRARCFMAIAAKDSAPYLRLERDLIMLAAMIANYLKALRSIFTGRGLFSPAFRTPLRCHQIPLVKDLLFLLGKEERFFALNADCFDVGHRNTSLIPFDDRMGRIYHICSFRFKVYVNESVSTCERTVSPRVSRLYPPSRHDTMRPPHTSSAHCITV